MDNIENYWAIANHTIAIINILVEGCLFCKFIQPFMKVKAYYVGISYSLAMLVFYCVPQQVPYPYLLGILVACTTMCLLERKRIKQKVFLAITMYLFRWMVYGVTLVLRDIMFALFINTPYMLTEPIKQWITYIIVELIYYGVAITIMYLVIRLIHKVYVNKREDISGKELILLFSPFPHFMKYKSFFLPSVLEHIKSTLCPVSLVIHTRKILIPAHVGA